MRKGAHFASRQPPAPKWRTILWVYVVVAAVSVPAVLVGAGLSYLAWGRAP